VGRDPIPARVRNLESCSLIYQEKEKINGKVFDDCPLLAQKTLKEKAEKRNICRIPQEREKSQGHYGKRY